MYDLRVSAWDPGTLQEISWFILTVPLKDKEELTLIYSQDTGRYIYVVQYSPWANKDRKSVSPSAIASSEVEVLLSDAH